MSALQSTATRPQRRVEGLVPERKLLGTVLLVIGAIIAAGFVSDQTDQYTLLGVSVTCLAAFALSREYGSAIPTGITGGLGTAIFFITSATFGPQHTPAVFFLSLAGGFAVVWLLGLLADPRERHPWPLVPATILGAFGVAFAAGEPGAIQYIQIAIAIVIIVAGAGMLLRRDHAA
jgi:hypothetical protein